MKMFRLSSRALESVGYDPATETLRIQFLGGGLYDYFNVPEFVYQGLRTDPHPWTVWGARIKSRFRYQRVE